MVLNVIQKLIKQRHVASCDDVVLLLTVAVSMLNISYPHMIRLMAFHLKILDSLLSFLSLIVWPIAWEKGVL